MRTLSISHLYPNRWETTKGIFVQQEIKAVQEADGLEIVLISPIPWSPPFLWINRKWRVYGKEPYFIKEGRHERYNTPYLVLPKAMLRYITGFTLFLSIFPLVKKLHNERPFDLIHAHTLIPDGYAALLASRYLKIPFICTVHGSDANTYPKGSLFYRKLAKQVIEKADRLIVVSKALNADVRSLGRPKCRPQLIPNSVDLSLVNSAENKDLLRERDNIPNDAVVIVFVGYLHKEKGIHELTEAYSYLAQRYSQLHLLIIGDGPERNNMEQKLSGYATQKRVRFLGQISHPQVFQWLCISDIFTLPSYHEGLPCSVVEALASGIPVVASNVGGIPEAVDDGVTGILIPPKDPKALISALEIMINDTNCRVEMGNKARERAIKYFSAEQHASSVISVYKEVLGH